MHNITWDHQHLLLQSTLLSSITDGRQLPTAYRTSFLRTIIQTLESDSIEVHDSLYELYVQLLNATDKSDPPKYVYKHFRLPTANHIVSIRESPNIISEGTTGLHSWQAAGALAEWALAANGTAELHGKNVLELGSGTGLTGFVIGKCCQVTRIVLTDGNERVLRLLADNLEENFDAISTTNVTVSPLDWFDIEQTNLLDDWKPDIILAADVVYDDSLFDALGRTVDFLFRKCANRVQMLLACTIRNEQTLESFMRILRSHQFDWCREPFVAPTHLYWDDTTPIHILRITRK